MPPQRMKPTKQECLQRRHNPLRRPSPARTSAPPAEGDKADDTMNTDNNDALHVEIGLLRAELANLRARHDDVCDRYAKLSSRIIAEQDLTIAEQAHTIAELKAALEVEKTSRHCSFNSQLQAWWNEDRASTPWNDLAAVGWGNFGVLTSADADLESTYVPSE
ncbi:hypothetical protein FN846DRAFT_890438 [Sphaerosporella brunnea]|uniref:Uncharacterized protein n=1 Tax=Sphaerosporella brunnea TaxID=1250544 RepID=A0A5J5EWE6_9PEZI|nr:hypothetical protein FN846DRAFT_890438 [Sphaerosporella brunnea]